MRRDPWKPLWYFCGAIGWVFYIVISSVSDLVLWSIPAPDRFTVSESAENSVPPCTPEPTGAQQNSTHKKDL